VRDPFDPPLILDRSSFRLQKPFGLLLEIQAVATLTLFAHSPKFGISRDYNPEAGESFLQSLVDMPA
jgi:hypothetical protein